MPKASSLAAKKALSAYAVRRHTVTAVSMRALYAHVWDVSQQEDGPCGWLDYLEAISYTHCVVHLLMHGESIVGHCINVRDAAWDVAAPRFIPSLWIDSAHRGKGLGKSLLRRSCLAHRQEIILTVIPTNARAVALYIRHGFVQQSEIWHIPVPGKSLIVMKRPAQ